MIENSDFTDAGATSGTALRWSMRTHVAREAIAAFDVPAQGEESFERWSAFHGDFDDVVGDRVFFGLAGSDGFDWLRSAFVDQLEPTMTLPALFGASTADAFAWDTLVEELATAVVAGAFNDDLERDWRNDVFFTELDAAHVATALFDASSASETFEGTWPALTRI